MADVTSNGHGPTLTPQNVEAEEFVLGTVLLSDVVLGALTSEEQLRPDHFYRESLALIFQAMLDLHSQGEPVDALTLVERLRQQGQFERIGGRAAIDVLCAGVPAVGNWRQYARVVKIEATRRRALRTSYELQIGASTPEISPQDIVELVERAALDLASELDAGADSFISARDYLAIERPPIAPYVQTPDGDSVVLARETGLLVGGPSGVAKSLAAIALAGRLASEHGGEWLDLQVTGTSRSARCCSRAPTTTPPRGCGS